jgi:hypothetical protein
MLKSYLLENKKNLLLKIFVNCMKIAAIYKLYKFQIIYKSKKCSNIVWLGLELELVHLI